MNLLFLTSNFDSYNIEQRLLQKVGYFTTHNYIKELSYLGFEYSFLYPLTLTIQSTKNYFLTLPLLRINECIKYSHATKEYSLIHAKITATGSNKNYFIYNKISNICSSLYPFFNSLHVLVYTGAKANLSQLYQLIGIRGYLSGIESNSFNLPILNNFSKGLNIFEYFTSCLGARKGVVDTAVKTADSGYLTKRLIGATQELVVKEYYCGTKNFCYHTQYINSVGNLSLPHKLLLHGKVLKMNIININTQEVMSYKNMYLTSSILTFLDRNKYKFFKLNLASIRLCSMERTICSTCLGTSTLSNNFLAKYMGVYVGQTVGEPSTQLTLRTFHTGGVCAIDTIKKEQEKKLTLFVLPTQKYKICSIFKYRNFVVYKRRYNLLTARKSNYIYFNKCNYLKQVNYNWMFILNSIHLFNFIWKDRFYSIFQRNISTKQNHNILPFSLFLANKSIAILIKNRHNKWVYLNINKPTILNNYTCFYLQVKKCFISPHVSINNNYSFVKVVKYNRALFNLNKLYPFYFRINTINILIQMNRATKIKLFTNDFSLLNFKKYYT